MIYLYLYYRITLVQIRTTLQRVFTTTVVYFWTMIFFNVL